MGVSIVLPLGFKHSLLMSGKGGGGCRLEVKAPISGSSIPNSSHGGECLEFFKRRSEVYAVEDDLIPLNPGVV